MTIRTLRSLYEHLDALFGNITAYCEICEYDDCRGMVWLLQDEATALLEMDVVPVLSINRDLSFIHSFPEEDGRIRIEAFKPRCRLYCAGKCTIYSQRPFVCRLYPLGFTVEDGQIYLVLYEDCRFSQQLLGTDRSGFISRAVALFRQIGPALLATILHTYVGVEALSSYPYGPNEYTRLTMLDTPLE